MTIVKRTESNQTSSLAPGSTLPEKFRLCVVLVWGLQSLPVGQQEPSLPEALPLNSKMPEHLCFASPFCLKERPILKNYF